MATRGPLNLFWYRKEQNFGDAISATVVAHVSGRDVAWAPQHKCDLYAVGSLLNTAAKRQREPRPRRPRAVIWGTGAMSGISDLTFLQNTRVKLVRGPLTAAMLQRDDRVFGDPGLLIAEALGDAPARDDVVGLVPHMHFADDPALHAVAAADPRICLIDVRDPDAHGVVRKIASCAHVISQSLHGLVTADAYGISSTWLDPKGIHGAATFKFYDYAAGIGRALGVPILMDQIAQVATCARGAPLSYGDGIAASLGALHETFPVRMRRAVAA